jgi:hypothetical protein
MSEDLSLLECYAVLTGKQLIGNVYQLITWCNIPEDLHLQQHSCEKLTSHTIQRVYLSTIIESYNCTRNVVFD